MFQELNGDLCLCGKYTLYIQLQIDLLLVDLIYIRY